jgi:hypothetical protein
MSENVRTDIDVTGPLQTRTQIKPTSHKSAHPVLAAHNWKENSGMIVDAARLGYLDGAVLDLSYGHGKFWKQWRPDELTTNDLDPTKGHHHFDVNDPAPDHWVEAFDAVVWDGPYRFSGTRDRGDFDEQYGLGKPVNADATLALLRAGVDFASLGHIAWWFWGLRDWLLLGRHVVIVRIEAAGERPVFTSLFAAYNLQAPLFGWGTPLDE